jgi:E3 ubiquitin-protein ligase HUWE1
MFCLDPPGFIQRQKEAEEEEVLPTLSEQLTLDRLWDTLSSCLLELADTPDHHAVLVLQVCD